MQPPRVAASVGAPAGSRVRTLSSRFITDRMTRNLGPRLERGERQGPGSLCSQNRAFLPSGHRAGRTC